MRQIKPGDRIAIKKMLGQGATEIEIRSIGIVEDVDHEEWRIYVKWIEIFGDNEFRHIFCDNERRLVPLKGAAASIHGPYALDDPNDGPWIGKIFRL